MKKTALLPVLLPALLLALSVAARAEAFKPAAVPASAFWVLHLDVAGLKATKAGRAILADPRVSGSSQMTQFATRFGLDPLTDIRGLTAYTVSTGRLDAVALIDPEPASAAKIKAKRESGGAVGRAYGRHTIYSSPDGGGVPFYATTEDGRFVAALTLERVRQALDVLDGKTAALSAATSPALADRGGGAGAVLVVAGRSFGTEMQGVLPQITILRNANSLCLTARENAGRVEAVLSVCTDDEPEAERIQNAFLGFVEIGRALAADGKPAEPDPAQAVTVTRAGKTVRAEGGWKTEEVLKLLGGKKAP